MFGASMKNSKFRGSCKAFDFGTIHPFRSNLAMANIVVGNVMATTNKHKKPNLGRERTAELISDLLAWQRSRQWCAQAGRWRGGAGS